MPDTTPSPSFFDDSYITDTPPWVIGEPQPAVVDLVRHGSLPRADGPSGPVLDVGRGAGEHTILLTEPSPCRTGRWRASSPPPIGDVS